MSFRGRLLRTAVAVTFVAMGGAFTGVWLAFNADQERQLDTSLTARAYVEAEHLATEGMFTGRPGPAANDFGPMTTFGVLFDDGGQPLVTNVTLRGNPLPELPELADQPRGRCFNTWYGNVHLRVMLLDVRGDTHRTMYYGVPRSNIDGDDRTLARAMGLALLVAVAWAAAVTSWVFGRLTRAHHSIALVARRVAAGDLQARVAEPEFADGEVLQLSRDVDDMIARLEGLVSSQRQFIAHAAHELRSPLTTLYGELQLALAKPRDDLAYREAIGEALISTRRLRDLAEDLLAFARMGITREGGTERVDLELLVAETCARLQKDAETRGVTLCVTTVPVYVTGTATDLERVLRNLVENAIRYAGEGATVAIEVSKENEMAKLVVEDDGRGIAEGDAERIFEPFYRAPRERGKPGPGAGLGLAIVREIARAHGGEIALAPPATGRGARFVVDLPLAPS